MLASFITLSESSSDGSSIQPIMPSGAPAATAASKTTLAAAMVDFLALGCGENMIPFLVFKARRDLKTAVDVGLVVGIMAAITPTGSAMRVVPKASSLSMTPHVLASLYLL